MISKIVQNSLTAILKIRLVLESKKNKFHTFILLQVREIQEHHNIQMKTMKLKS